MGALETPSFSLELWKRVSVPALPNGFLNGAQAARAEANLLLTSGECGIPRGRTGAEGEV